MRGTTRTITPGNRDEGAGGFILWIVVYAVFMVALIALNGGSYGLGFHEKTAAERLAVR
ncbi:hypothetical protein BH10PSE9_BH10PSE9_20170 [soil metagenome]